MINKEREYCIIEPFIVQRKYVFSDYCVMPWINYSHNEVIRSLISLFIMIKCYWSPIECWMDRTDCTAHCTPESCIVKGQNARLLALPACCLSCVACAVCALAYAAACVWRCAIWCACSVAAFTWQMDCYCNTSLLGLSWLLSIIEWLVVENAVTNKHFVKLDLLVKSFRMSFSGAP